LHRYLQAFYYVSLRHVSLQHLSLHNVSLHHVHLHHQSFHKISFRHGLLHHLSLHHVPLHHRPSTVPHNPPLSHLLQRVPPPSVTCIMYSSTIFIYLQHKFLLHAFLNHIHPPFSPSQPATLRSVLHGP
jgi:uncharacterized protein YjbI with pentapeptide repeats